MPSSGAMASPRATYSARVAEIGRPSRGVEGLSGRPRRASRYLRPSRPDHVRPARYTRPRSHRAVARPPAALTEVITLGRTLAKRAADMLAYFEVPGTSNAPTEAING